MKKVICPYCGKEVTNDPIDSEDYIDISAHMAYMESHYDCLNCGHWFTLYITAKLQCIKTGYLKRD